MFSDSSNLFLQKKKVTLVHSEKQLLNDVYPDKWRQDIERRVRKRNIDLILGDRLDSFPEPGAVGVTTRNGKQLRDADLIVSFSVLGQLPASY